MLGSRQFRKRLSLICILLLFFVAGGVFLLRSPVLIVTDSSFNMLYGTFRIYFAVIKNSIEFFRRVIPVTVAESAGPDLMALAVEGASRSPMAVLFPYRYLDAAQFYRENHAEIPVLVLGGRGLSPDENPDLAFVGTDTELDLYRTGLSAAVLAGDKKVLLFNEGAIKEEYRVAFEEGLKAQEILANEAQASLSGQDSEGDVQPAVLTARTVVPVYTSVSADFPDYSDYGCIVVFGPAVRFLENTPHVPVILFSWIDPVLTPWAVKLVFNDSPWVQLKEALSAFPAPGEEIVVPSEPILLKDRIEEEKDFRKLQGFIKEKFEEKVKKTGPES